MCVCVCLCVSVCVSVSALVCLLKRGGVVSLFGFTFWAFMAVEVV